MQTADHSVTLQTTDPAAPSAVAGAVDHALADAAGRVPRLSVRLAGDGLPAPLVGALVLGLRRLRELGGSVAVVPETPEVRAALELHGLEAVFAVAPEPGKPASRGGRWQPGRAAAALLAAVLVAIGAHAPARAQGVAPLTDPHEILARVVERNPELDTFQGRLHVAIKLNSFPFFREHLDATTYYKRPANYEVVFDRLPSYARGFEKLYTDVGDASNWEKRFVVTYEGTAPFDGRQDVQLRMVQRVRGMIDHETVLVDPAEDTVDQIRYDYYNGGHITMTQAFRRVGDYLLLSAQTARIAIPHVNATATGTYDGYRTNVAIDDAVFVRAN